MTPLKLFDWNNNYSETTIDIDNLSSVESITIRVITGDEIAYVNYKDGSSKKFDSSKDRLMDYDDGSYTLYVDGQVNLIDEFLNRKDSYDMFRRSEKWTIN